MGVKLDNKTAATNIKLDNKAAVSAVSDVLKISDIENKLNGNKTGITNAASIVEGLELVNDVPVADADGEMIYLLVDDGTDPNLENQTLYIDPSQLAAAAGGLVLQNDAAGGLVLQGDGGVPMILQGATSSQSGQILIQNADGALSNLVILDDKESAVVTSADTTGGVATLPSIPSSSLLSQVPLITTSSQQGPIMVSSMGKDEKK